LIFVTLDDLLLLDFFTGAGIVGAQRDPSCRTALVAVGFAVLVKRRRSRCADCVLLSATIRCAAIGHAFVGLLGECRLPHLMQANGFRAVVAGER
jgi:hypothetical protein